MRMYKTIIAGAVAAALALAGTGLYAKHHGGGHGGPDGCEQKYALQGGVLSEADKTSLALMREEEKLARDLYQALAAKWDLKAFKNITRAEQHHMDRVKSLLQHYGLPDPALAEAGRFNNTKLQKLYDDLLARGQQSEVEALKVGALVEEVDIKDLREALATTQNPDLQKIYGHLVQASENHLRAFTRQLKRRGEATYTAQAMTQADVDAILAKPNNRHGHGGKGGHGGRGGHGHGYGQGQY